MQIFYRVLSVFLLGTIFLLGACTQDDIENKSDRRITLSAKMQTIEQTRSDNPDLQNTWLSSGLRVGVYANTNDGNSSFISRGNNQMQTMDDNGVLSGTAIYWPEQSVYIHAYAPYDASWTDAGNQIFSVQTDQSTDDGYLQSDLLYGIPLTNPVNEQSNPVSLEFTHKLAKVIVNFTMTTNGPSLRGASIEILNILPSINFDPLTGNLGSATGNKTSIKAADFSTGETTTFTCSALVVPQTIISGTAFIRVTDMNGTISEYIIDRETTFEEGNVYNYHVALGTGEVVSDNDVMDIYLCIGQSNMSGLAEITDAQKGQIPGVYLLNLANEFEVAENPLNKYSTIEQDVTRQLSMAYSFSLKMKEQTKRKIGLIVNARGGTKIAAWLKGNSAGYYDAALKRTKASLKYGALKGIIWHQGEYDRDTPDAYKGQIKTLISDLRTDLKQPELPVVVGQIGRWHNENTNFNNMIITVPTFIEHTVCVTTEDLQGFDYWHFDTQSQLTFGERYADAMLQLLNEK